MMFIPGQRVMALRDLKDGEIRKGSKGTIYTPSETACVDWDDLVSGHNGSYQDGNRPTARPDHCWNIEGSYVAIINEDWDI